MKYPNFGPFHPARAEFDRYVEEQIKAGAIQPLPDLTFSTPVIHPPPKHKKRQLWFLRLLARRTPVTRLLSALTTRKVTAVLMYGKETLPDRNRTRKIDGV